MLFQCSCGAYGRHSKCGGHENTCSFSGRHNLCQIPLPVLLFEEEEDAHKLKLLWPKIFYNFIISFLFGLLIV